MSRKSGKHIVVMEAYQGQIELLSDEPEELKSAQGLGLPIEEIAEARDCRITVFRRDEWLRYDLSHGLSHGSPYTWASNPVTRLPLDDPGSESGHARAHLYKAPRDRRKVQRRDRNVAGKSHEAAYAHRRPGNVGRVRQTD